MTPSPQQDTTGAVNVLVSCNGKPMRDGAALVSVEVREALGTITSARLVFADGDMAKGEWPTADGDNFAPGTTVQIQAGYGDRAGTIFEGVVVRLGARITEGNDSTLIVDCRDKALAMTVNRRHDVYIDMTDSAIFTQLLGDSGLAADVEATSIAHGGLVQYHATDWDFLMTRAELNGMLVKVRAGKVSVRKPPESGAAVLKVTWGADLMSFRADVDARSQLESVEASAWDPKTQAMIDGGARRGASLPPLGNLDGKVLAAVLGTGSVSLQTAVPLDKAALQAWGDAQQLKAGLARLRGEMKFQGSAKAEAGVLIEVAGVGKRFEGTVLVSAVTHRIESGNWTTEAEFGLSDLWFSRKPDVNGPPAGGRLPAISGLQVGVVKKLDADPLSSSRVLVALPAVAGLEQAKGVWARVMQFHASKDFGAFFMPEVGDEVVVAFFDGDPCAPVLLGSLYSSSRNPPYALEAPNDTKALVTRCRHKLVFDEKDKIITLTTPAGNQVVLDDKDRSIHLHDQNGNKVELDPSGIRLSTPKDVRIDAKGSVSIDAVGPISLSSQADVKCSGLNVSCSAQVGFVGKGSATAELSAAGQTTVKGAMVMIN